MCYTADFFDYTVCEIVRYLKSAYTSQYHQAITDNLSLTLCTGDAFNYKTYFYGVLNVHT